MIEQTQSHLAPYGNCWQTAVACILGLEADRLPLQSAVEQVAEESRTEFGGREWPAWLSWLMYRNVLNRYLWTHHNLQYGEVRPPVTNGVRVESFGGHHVICGPSVRTASNGGLNHCVVGRHGEEVWDPHPSRAGLLSTNEWGVIAAPNSDWEPNPKMYAELPCLCPECGGIEQLRPHTAESASSAES